MRKLLLLFTLLLPVAAAAQGFRTTLRGTVIGRDSRALALFFRESPLSHNPLDTIPIVDGRFEQTIEGEAVRAYKLWFLEDVPGGGMFWEFLPDAEVVEMTLDAAEQGRDRTEGGELNRRLQELQSKKHRLDDSAWDLPEDLARELETLRDYSSAHGRAVQARRDAFYDSLNMVCADHDYLLYEKHDDLAAYSLFMTDIYFRNFPTDMALVDRVAAKFAAAHPGHPYNEIVAQGVSAAKMKKSGGRFVDFSAPDMNGTMHDLSREIEGRVALIDLWASWCGPCISASRRMVPVYNEWKDKGFTVVGVARETGSTENLAIALEREKFPWLTLVELDDRAGIWVKYGMGGAAGGMFLVDKQGMIVKVDPSADEVREYLEKNLE
jgi:thiol-disulfide isomerase/thioredoxin